MSLDALAVSHEEREGRGAFFFEREGVRLAELTMTRAGPHVVIIDHTEVHPKAQGMGVARRLLDAAVLWARESGSKVIATCPYAKAQFAKDPSIRDVLEDPASAAR
jgi:predicted GNAT family acetyltransferase